MDKIERVRHEIERRIALYSGWSNETVHPTRIDEDKQLLSFLDTLSEEPVSEDLEEAARQYGYTYNADWPGQVPAARDGFIAGAKWQKEQMMNELFFRYERGS